MIQYIYSICTTHAPQGCFVLDHLGRPADMVDTSPHVTQKWTLKSWPKYQTNNMVTAQTIIPNIVATLTVTKYGDSLNHVTKYSDRYSCVTELCY